MVTRALCLIFMCVLGAQADATEEGCRGKVTWTAVTNLWQIECLGLDECGEESCDMIVLVGSSGISSTSCGCGGHPLEGDGCTTILQLPPSPGPGDGTPACVRRGCEACLEIETHLTDSEGNLIKSTYECTCAD